MKIKLHFKITALIFVLFSLNSTAQFVDYEGRDTKWNIGINTGGVWQDGDIKLRTPGFGYGFMIGKGIYEAPNHFWSFDVRFRYMKGRTYGQDSELSEFSDNPIYSDSATDYKSAYFGTPLAGKTFYNNKTDIHDFSLEGVVNLYWLRKKTGVLLSVFGGLGVTDYRTRTDLTYIDSNGYNKLYKYEPIANNATVDNIRNIQDKKYESYANFNKKQQIKFMPSLGFGLGYQFTPKFSLGFEHRVTFTLADKFDGVEKVGTEFLKWGNNDKYHYTSINLRWDIFRGEKSTTTRDKKCKPYVKIAKLKDNTVNTETIIVKTRVSKIESNNDVILSNNDSAITTTYNKSTDYVTGTVKLKRGINHIYFYASNNCGENADSAIVIYNPDYCPKPYIEILEPAAKEEVSNVKLKVKVAHVENATIEVKLNNKVITHSLNAAKDLLTADLTLLKNDNYINIRAVNSCGDTIVAKHVVFKEKPCFPPVATISTPVNGVTYKTASVSFVATTTNITNVNQVSFWLNGKLLYAAYDVSTKIISANLDLIQGNNTITLKVKNKCGEDVKTVNFIYKEGCKAPAIFSMIPNANKTVTTNKIAFNGNVQNVKLVDQVHLKVNGVEINSGFTTQYGQAYTTITLAKGRNKIEFSATNECGTDSKTVYIVYRCTDPYVNITSPFNGTNSNVRTISVAALVNGAKTPQSIKLKLNGVAQVFYFDSSTNNVTANVSLRQGQNTIEVTATNDCKTVSKTISVSYNQSCPKPVVNITSPANGSNQTNNYITLTGTVTNIMSKNQMQIKLNGVTKSFTYNASSKTYNATLNLRSGSNSIVVSATTNCGNDSKTISVNYAAPCPKPTLNITSHSSGAIANSNIVIAGTVSNVSTQNQIKVTVNGINKSVSYNASTKRFSSSVNLRNGNNTIIATATTSCGSVSKTVNLNYTQSCPKPVVVITSPLHGNIVTSRVVSFGGTVTNINSQSELRVTVNGVNQTFTYNSSVRAFSGNATLVSGNNVIVVTATTNCGTSSKSVTVLNRCANPTLNILSPSTGMNYPMSAITLSAITSGVSAKSQITMKQNGSPIAFTFDTRTSKIVSNLTLVSGSNTIVVSATNNCGTVSKTLSLTYTKPCPKPLVTISSPVNGSTVSTAQITLAGTALNVSNKSQVSVKSNGSDKVFTFNTATKTFTGTIALVQGNNTIIVTGTTPCGVSTKTINVIYTPCVKPTVDISSPAFGQNSTTTPIQGMATVTNVTSKSQLTVKLNGNTIPFTLSGNRVTASLALKNGSNFFLVKASSPCGNDEKSIGFNYTEPCKLPVVVISSPANGISTNSNTITVTGTVNNISSKSNLTILLNGAIKTFTYNASTKSYVAVLTLRSGSNTIKVEAGTVCGNDSKIINVTSNQKINPIVTVYTPAKDTTNGAAGQSQTKVGGMVEKITQASQFVIRVNNVVAPGIVLTPISSGKFEFNGLLNINPGVNVITFTATHVTGGTHRVVKTYILPVSIKNVVPRGNLNPRNGQQKEGGVSPR